MEERGFTVIELTTDQARGHAVAYTVEALCYKPEGHGLESRRGN
jgi:hypothetical protein